MNEQQGELPLKKRRIKLDEAEAAEADRRFGQPHYGHGDEMEEELQLRVPKEVADAVAADPEGAAQRLELEAQRMLAELMTPWCTEERPPVPGYWEVTDHKTGTLSEHWWWSGAHWELPEGAGESPRNFVGHESFKAAYAWRGLKEPPKEGYPIPPYNAMMFALPGRITPPLYPRSRLVHSDPARSRRRKLED